MSERGGGRLGAVRPGGGQILALTVALVVVLGCALLAGYGYIRARQTAQSLANSVPLRETVVIRPDAPAILREVRQLSKLESASYTIEKILDAERTRRYVPKALAGEKLIFVAHGQVVAGLDLSKLTENEIDISGDSIKLRLPEPEILYSRIDNEKSYVYERDTGIFSRPDKDLESQVRADAERQLREDALEDGILEEARKNARRTMEALLASVGYVDIKFE